MGSDTAVEREGEGKARTSGTARDGREDAWGHRNRRRNARANTKHLLTPLLIDCLLALPLFHSRPRERPSGDDSRSRCKECDVAAKARREGTSTTGERAWSRIVASRARNGQSSGNEGEAGGGKGEREREGSRGSRGNSKKQRSQAMPRRGIEAKQRSQAMPRRGIEVRRRGDRATDRAAPRSGAVAQGKRDAATTLE